MRRTRVVRLIHADNSTKRVNHLTRMIRFLSHNTNTYTYVCYCLIHVCTSIYLSQARFTQLSPRGLTH